MTTDQEINEAVARKLGWVRLDGAPCWSDPYGLSHGDDLGTGVPDYCHSIEAIWEVVLKFGLEDGAGNFELKTLGSDCHWYCELQGEIGEADTAPMAICLAFLKLK